MGENPFPSDDPLLKDIPDIADHALGVIDDFNRIKAELSVDATVPLPEISPEEVLKVEGDYKDYIKDLQKKREHSIFNELIFLNTTDFGNASRFITWHGDNVSYCPPFDWWYIWDEAGGRWKKDDAKGVQELGKAVILNIYEEAAKAPNKDRREQLAKWAIKCETPGTVARMLDVAQSDQRIVVMPDRFDQNPFLVNLENGYYNLVEMKFCSHDKANYFSMMLPFRYDSKAACPRWIKFLNRMFASSQDREKTIEFLQRGVGYTLTGDTMERAIFLMHGMGANGKTVFIRVLEALFGDYGAAAQSSSFTTAMSTNVRNDLAALKGKRFVWASENSSDTVLDEENIKRMSGGDTIRCRFLFKEEFEYRPNFKIWWIFNHKPKIRDATDSIWDRIHLVPCNERIPKEEQDKKLVDKLAHELPGIFNWALDGYRKYCVDGLQPPASVIEATKEYRQSEDVLADFITEMCEEVEQKTLDELSTDVRTPFSEIWEAWRQYTSANNEKTRTKQWLGRKLDEKFKRYRTNSEKGFVGVRVRYQTPPPK